jgi:3-deoxy-D-manno-octulosonic-acid transferase
MLIYNIVVRLYFFTIWIVSFFNQKAKLWINGRNNVVFKHCDESIWFHFASLGEFEQGRPVLEKLRKMYPGDKMIITFFSPSGYEIRKNTTLADDVYYLPLDTEKNARDFISSINPKMAIFTKYEYWYHFFNELHKKNIPLYLISGIFRPGQIFFKWYGGFNRKILKLVTFFFVQDEQSEALLHGIGMDNVNVSGDTRFDRVWANAGQPRTLTFIDEFKNGHKLFIAGSTWAEDQRLAASLVTEYPDWKFVFAPHEVSEEKIKKIISMLPVDTVIRYSEFKTTHQSPATTHQTLIIDNIGMLSALYQYADIAYIGGGFGSGIHNTLEAAAFGLPVVFGPNYRKFKEATDLIRLNAAFSIANEAELKAIVNKLIHDRSVYSTAKQMAAGYVKTHRGATAIIIEKITLNL